MKSIIFKSLGLALLGSVVMTSCTKEFEEFNKNPYEPDHFSNMAGQFIRNMTLVIIPYQNNDFQMSQNLVGDNYSGYMASPGPFGGANSNTYFWRDGWVNEPYRIAMTGIYGSLIEIKKNTDEFSYENIAMANIMRVASMHRITDIYGPIPYSKAGTGELTSAYDSQEDVYKGMIADLDDAINFLYTYSVANPDARPMRKYDNFFKGNMSYWARWGNTLKLRLAVRMAYASPVFAQKVAEEAVNHPAGLIETADQMVSLPCSDNPLYTMWNDYTDTRMGASVQSIMGGYADPRLEKYFQPATIDNPPYKFMGVRNGIQTPTKDNYTGAAGDPVKFSAPATKKGDPMVIMNCAEAFFLRAEGALRGWAMGGDAKSLYESGIDASFGMYNLSADSYTSDDIKTPMDYVSPVAQSPGAPALSNITIKWDDAATFEKNLERIATQKWIALYPDGQEAWTEFRRTGYPKIFPVVYNSNTATINTATQIRRLPFPQAEYQNNGSEVAKAIALLGGLDNGGTKLWWDKK